MLLQTIFCAVLLLATSAAASPAKVTYYLDGALVESEAAAAKGPLEIPLPRGMVAGTLRVKPLQGGAITQVEIVPSRADKQLEKEAARLEHLFQSDQRKIGSLADRIQGLPVVFGGTRRLAALRAGG